MSKELTKENEQANFVNQFDDLLRLRVSQFVQECITNSQMPTFIKFEEWLETK